MVDRITIQPGYQLKATTARESVRPMTSSTSTSKRLFTAAEAGAYLGFRSAWPIRELMWKGALPVVRIGKRRIAFDVHDLDHFIEQNKTRETLDRR